MARDKRDEKAVKEDEKKPNPQTINRHSQGREWGTGEISRVQMHQAQVTAPREGTMEVEKLKRTDEKKEEPAQKPPGSRGRQKNTRKGVEEDERRGKEPSGEQLKG